MTGKKQYFLQLLVIKKSKISASLSLNNPVAPFASIFVKAMVDHRLLERMQLVLIKKSATCYTLNDVRKNSNIRHTYLYVFVLQKFLNKEQITSLDDLVQKSNSFDIASEFLKPLGITTVASLLLDFFKFYSREVNFIEMAISVRGGCLLT